MNTTPKKMLARVAATVIIAAATWQPACAQDAITLRAHHFMSAKATLHEKMLVPLAERLRAKTDGRLNLQIFHSMSLGGRPADLYDQAVDGAVDIILTVPGYTSGRFNKTEVFELPFMMTGAVPTTKAFWTMMEQGLQDDEYSETKILAAWVHGPGVIHSKKPIGKLEDIRGMEMRGPTRLINDYLGEIGAVPVGMPLPQIPENLAKGVIAGTLLPWEITPTIRLNELVQNHTELTGARALYTATLVLAMNWDAYEAMPADLRAALDEEIGAALSEQAAQTQFGADAFARDLAGADTIRTLDENEVARWMSAAQPVYERWIARASDKGFDGEATIEQARALIAAAQ